MSDRKPDYWLAKSMLLPGVHYVDGRRGVTFGADFTTDARHAQRFVSENQVCECSYGNLKPVPVFVGEAPRDDEALALTERMRGEPVGWRYRNGVCGWKLTDYGGKAEAMRRDGYEVQPVYAGPPEPAEQEPADDPAPYDPGQACEDCPIGGREGSGPVCANAAACDRQCEEDVRVAREAMGRKPGEACCDLWERVTAEPADDPATAEARELHAQGLLPMPEDRGCEAVGRVGRYVSKATYDAAVRLLAERDTDPELPSLRDMRAGHDAGDEDDYDGKVL